MILDAGGLEKDEESSCDDIELVKRLFEEVLPLGTDWLEEVSPV